MTEANPMRSPSVRGRVSKTLKKIGHKPPVQGGNGRGLSEAQRVLFLALGCGWKAEYIVAMDKGMQVKGYPTHYKVDLANERAKVAVEVDGGSHNCLSVKARDVKKTKYLESKGWKVFRFQNGEVIRDVQTVANLITSTT
jgi:hypothetical protein